MVGQVWEGGMRTGQSQAVLEAKGQGFHPNQANTKAGEGPSLPAPKLKQEGGCRRNWDK